MAVETVLGGRERGETVLVHCSAGASRGVSIAAALAVREDLDVREAFQRVGESRPAADPHPSLVRRTARFPDER